MKKPNKNKNSLRSFGRARIQGVNTIMIRFLILTVFLISSYKAEATRQIPDFLFIGESRFHIRTYPLNSLDEWSIYTEKNNADFEICSGAWRGYKADWEIKSDYLWLLKVEKNPCGSNEYININEVLSETKYPVKAKWFSGKIQLQIGETKYIYKNGRKKIELTESDFEKIDLDKTGNAQKELEKLELIGVNYEVLVFNFKKGKLKGKNIELFKKRFEH